jgi:VanZ family protein
VRSEAGLLTRGALPHRLPNPCAGDQWHVAGERLPSQRRDRPGLAPGSLTALRLEAGLYHRPVRGEVLRRWLPVVAWAAVIFAFSSVPDLGTGLGGWDLLLRKLAHVAEYALLGALLARALESTVAAAAIGIAYAVTDELHQTTVEGRVGSPRDVAVDAAGVLLGIAAVRWAAGRRRRAVAPDDPVRAGE